MGVLDNTTITVDAILTKKGRELLAQGEGKFKITKFALADDEIDYGLYDITHPNGSNFYGAAIENMNLLEAVPNQTLAVKYFLSDEVGVGTGAPQATITGPTSIKASQTGVFTANTSDYGNELYEWVLDSTEYATIVSAPQAPNLNVPALEQDNEFGEGSGGYGSSGTGGSGNSTQAIIAPQVTIRVKAKGVLGGSDRQVVLRAKGVNSEAPAVQTIDLIRD